MYRDFIFYLAIFVTNKQNKKCCFNSPFQYQDKCEAKYNYFIHLQERCNPSQILLNQVAKESFISKANFSVCIPFPTDKQVSHFGALIIELLLSKKSQLLSLHMKNKTVLWAGLICPLGRHLKFLLDKVTDFPLPLLAVIIEVYGV